jgi:hypothetical protein
VYGTGVETLIAQLPEPLLSQRLADLESWRADGRPLPEPLVRVPGRHERTEAQLDELFAKCADGFMPLGDFHKPARQAVREFLPFAVLPPFVEDSPGLAADFWKLHPPIDKASIGEACTAGCLGALAMRPHSPWLGIADTFVRWATGATCHFTSPELEARYGFDAVPPGVVIAVRRWQLARFLFQHGAPPAWPPPPAALDGARQFVEYLLHPQPFLPDYAPDEPLSPATICASLAELHDRVPALRTANTPVNWALLDAVGSLLNRAADQPASSPSVRKTRSRPARRPPA